MSGPYPTSRHPAPSGLFASQHPKYDPKCPSSTRRDSDTLNQLTMQSTYDEEEYKMKQELGSTLMPSPAPTGHSAFFPPSAPTFVGAPRPPMRNFHPAAAAAAAISSSTSASTTLPQVTGAARFFSSMTPHAVVVATSQAVPASTSTDSRPSPPHIIAASAAPALPHPPPAVAAVDVVMTQAVPSTPLLVTPSSVVEVASTASHTSAPASASTSAATATATAAASSAAAPTSGRPSRSAKSGAHAKIQQASVGSKIVTKPTKRRIRDEEEQKAQATDDRMIDVEESIPIKQEVAEERTEKRATPSSSKRIKRETSQQPQPITASSQSPNDEMMKDDSKVDLDQVLDPQPKGKRKYQRKSVVTTPETTTAAAAVAASSPVKQSRSSKKLERQVKRFNLAANTYILGASYKADITSGFCACKPAPTPGGKSCLVGKCMNALLLTECPSDCPLNDQCFNQRFTKRQYANIEVRDVGKKGYGLFTTPNGEGVKKGEFIIEYVGEVLDEDNVRDRIELYRNSQHFYLMTLANGLSIDATQKGNRSRFINHSCSPNAETQKWEASGLPCVGIFARVDIPADTEITFDYQYERYGGKKQKCLCGSTNCAGFLGGRPRPVASADGCTCATAASSSSSSSSSSDPCPIHNASNDTDELDSIQEEERKTGTLIDAVTISTRRILRMRPQKSRTGASAAAAAAAALASHSSRISGSRVKMEVDSNTSSTSSSSASSYGPSRATPSVCFPRALLRANTNRVIQIFHTFQHVQRVCMPRKDWRPNDESSEDVYDSKASQAPVSMLLHELLDGKLPKLYSSSVFHTTPTTSDATTTTTTTIGATSSVPVSVSVSVPVSVPVSVSVSVSVPSRPSRFVK